MIIQKRYEEQHESFYSRFFLQVQPKIVHITSHRKQSGSQMDLQLSALRRGKKTPTAPFDILNLPSVTSTYIYEYIIIYFAVVFIYDAKPIKIALNILQKYQVLECIQHAINYWKMLTIQYIWHRNFHIKCKSRKEILSYTLCLNFTKILLQG